MKVTIDVNAHNGTIAECLECNIEVQKEAINNSKTDKEAFTLMGTLSLLLKLSLAAEKKSIDNG